MFTDNYDSSFCFWVFEKKLTQENCFSFVKSMKKINNLNGLLSARKRTNRTVLNAMMQCMFTDNYDSSVFFWVFEKRLTQKNCFPFCKKYGLFNSFIFLTMKKFLLSYFPNFHDQRSGGTRSQSCFSHGEGSFKEPIHKQFYSK